MHRNILTFCRDEDNSDKLATFACVCAGARLNERQRFTYGLDDDQMYIATSGHLESTTVPLGADTILILCAQSSRSYPED